jgi:CRP-like cAMP-binding protein
MFIAIYFLSFNISSISNLAAEADYKKNLLIQKMNIIESYSKNEGINKSTQSKMKVEVTEKSTRVTHTAEDRQELLSYLPMDLKFEIAFNMQKGVISDFRFFRDKPKEFISNVFPLLYQKYLIEKEIVYMQNQDSNEIYFISEGKVSLVYSSFNVPFRYLVFGEYFGDYEVTNEAKRVFGAISTRYTKLLVMSKDTVEKFKRDFPSLWSEFREKAKYRHEVNIRAMSEMMVIKKINSEGVIKNITSKKIKEMIQVQAGILTHKSLDFSLEEIRKREVVDLRKNILEQRNVIFNILHGTKYLKLS